MSPPLGPCTSHSAQISAKIAPASCHLSLGTWPNLALSSATCSRTAFLGRAPLLRAIPHCAQNMCPVLTPTEKCLMDAIDEDEIETMYGIPIDEVVKALPDQFPTQR